MIPSLCPEIYPLSKFPHISFENDNLSTKWLFDDFGILAPCIFSAERTLVPKNDSSINAKDNYDCVG